MTAPAPVLDDPIGVIADAVGMVEPRLDPPVVREVVAAVAGGRAKQRRLAQALTANPDVLRTGRSPAPRAVGDLLIELRQASAQTVAAPVCAGCDRLLSSLHRRGQDWYCSGCATTQAQPCSGCGANTRVAARDGQGRPLCQRCKRGLGADAASVVAQLVAAIDPDLAADVVAAAVTAAAPQSGQRARLAAALTARPDLLTGAGAHSPVPAVLRLIEQLCAAGATGVVRPACPHCHRVVVLSKRVGAVRLCRNCLAKSRAQPCHRCGARREPAARDGQGEAICAYCLTNDPVNRERCVGCGQIRLVAVRTAEGARCGTCRPRPTVVCAICGQPRRCTISRTTGQPWCSACRQRWDTCTGCGQIKPVRSGRRDEPLCATCTRPDPTVWQRCPSCGDENTERMWGGACPRCVLRQQLHDLLADNDGTIRPELQQLYDTVAAHDRPVSALGWLHRESGVAPLLRDIGAGRGQLSHERLDEIPDSRIVRQLRGLLVAAGALAPRDEHMARIQSWIAATIAGHPDAQQRQILHRYAVWFMLRRLRGRTHNVDTTDGQASAVRARLRAAIATLDWLTARGLTLHTCGQAHIDTWLAGPGRTRRFAITHFLRWAATQRLTTVELPGAAWAGPVGVIDTEQRWEQIRRLLHDDTLATADRLAGLFILCYAQFPATVAKLRTDDIDTADHQVRLRLGDQPIVLPQPLADLTRAMLAATPRRAIGEPKASPWLFPGGRAGAHVTATNLAQRLRRIGVQAKPGRETALFQLANEVPAAILARLLGIHISVATTWQRVSAGDWTRYAADLSPPSTDTT